MEDKPLPRLRPLDVRRVAQNGGEYLLLRDPLELTGQQVLVPLPLAPLLALLDGSRTLNRLRVELLLRFGLALEAEHLRGLVETLSRACLLEDEAYTEALQRAREAYRTAPYRAPALAGRVYPSEPEQLTAALRAFEERVSVTEAEPEGLAGLISPHIDYARGGPVYAALWRRAAPAARAAEVAVIFGTDHSGAPGTLTLTHQAYATPWGVLPTDHAAVAAMAAVLGDEAAFAEELHHRAEHSVELAAVWLHYVRDGVPCTVIPVLCGHPLPFMAAALEADAPAGAETRAAWQRALDALAALRAALAGRRVIAIAAADLAHVGPAFGDPEPFSPWAKYKVRLADEELLAACAAGPEAVLRAVGRIEDRFRICGLAPIALTLAFTGPVQAETVAYEQCPADHDGGDGSIVSIAGVLLRRPPSSPYREEGHGRSGERAAQPISGG